MKPALALLLLFASCAHMDGAMFLQRNDCVRTGRQFPRTEADGSVTVLNEHYCRKTGQVVWL